MNQGVGKWGASTFAKRYATGGYVSRVFPVEGLKMKRGILGQAVRERSPAYMSNLRRMQAQGGKIGGAAGEVLKKTTPLSAGQRVMGGLGRGIFGTALVAGVPAMLASGGTGERLKAAASGITSEIGWHVGGVIGHSVGGIFGPVGSAIGGIVGRVAGGFIGWAGGEVLDPVLKLAERSKRARTSNWVQDNSAFTTRKAMTMRQTSLQMMNTGMTTARSALGHEGVMFHR